ncbi:hypothetical protein HK101_001069 [Irineochytrium annulatum]|nr:hypothetical protein HK101_001069 [Irineochytrium annulatum]
MILDANTHDCVSVLYQTTDLGRIKVKGKTNELHVYGIPFIQRAQTVVNKKAIERRFGYKREEDIMREKFEDWMVNDSRCMLVIEAPSGFGKSCLSKFLIETATAQQVSYCLTQGTEMEQLTPYSGLQTVMKFIFYKVRDCQVLSNPLRPSQSHASVRSSYSHAFISKTFLHVHAPDGGSPMLLNRALEDFLKVADVDLVLLPLLSLISPSLGGEDNSRTAQLDGAVKNNLLKTIVVRIIIAFTRRMKALFIFDDTQWLDSKTLEVLSAITRTSQKVRLDCDASGFNGGTQCCMQILTRPVESIASEALQTIMTHPETVHMKLGGLSGAEIAEMIVR